MKIVVIDNYDSFTYNLVEYLHKLGISEVAVFRNDKITVAEISKYDKIVLSPGAGLPSEAGILQEIIREYAESKSILGICLGHQAIAEVFGGILENGKKVYHGIQSTAIRTAANKGCLHNLPKEFEIAHYHSWYVAEENLPACFDITCYDSNGLIMGIVHKEYCLEGIQFHPESVLTPLGLRMLENWLKIA